MISCRDEALNQKEEIGRRAGGGTGAEAEQMALLLLLAIVHLIITTTLRAMCYDPQLQMRNGAEGAKMAFQAGAGIKH